MTIAEILTLLSGGGGTVVVIYVLKSLYQAFVDRWSHQIEEKKTDITERTASISDAATANTLLLATIDAMHKANDRLDTTNKDLVIQLEKKNQHIERLQAEITVMQKHLADMYDQLEAAKLTPPAPGRE